ncbi:unnamed protein product [Thelazia callipaeda]|uniref:BEN domain-containing protein n=1 Tax=Thelazia callipaeda TaxID=103827 RepID=A0A0N5D5Q2_THECL|nr:unnamed protein product [Thelazia callipaeda]
MDSVKTFNTLYIKKRDGGLSSKIKGGQNDFIKNSLRSKDPETQVRKIGLTTCSSIMPNNSFKRISCDVTTDIIHRRIQQFTQASAADFVKATKENENTCKPRTAAYRLKSRQQ